MSITEETIIKEGFKAGIEITLDKLQNVISSKFMKKELNYDLESIVTMYAQEKDILEWKDSNGDYIALPYTVLYKYPNGLRTLDSWGEIKPNDSKEYKLPNELRRHQEKMKRIFEERKKIIKRYPATRICDFYVESNTPIYTIEEAKYIDQIGTNLTLDYKTEINTPIGVISTVREWDQKNSKSDGYRLPSLKDSRLANTLGIAVGLYVNEEKTGKRFPVMRKRGRNVAIYPNMWSFPLSFSHSIDFTKFNLNSISFNELVLHDMAVEISQELSLELYDLDNIKPLALCRELIRGGKPHLFIEAEVKHSFEELLKMTKKVGKEYRRSIRKYQEVSRKELPKYKIAPEFLAFIAIEQQRRM